MLNIPPQLIVLLVSMIPIGELRAAIPLAYFRYHFSLGETLFWSILGNMIPVFFIVYLLPLATAFFEKRSNFLHNILQKLFHYTRKKHSKKFERIEEIALISFVAIPFPVTGAWSGALASFVFGIKPKKSILCIFGGVVIAAIIVSTITFGLF